MKNILIINSCQWKKDFIFERLFNLWYEIHLADKEIPYSIKCFIFQLLPINTFSINDSYNKIIEYYRNNQINWVITFWEDDVLLLARIVETLKLPGSPFFIAEKIRNKYKFRQECKKNQIITPDFIELNENTILNIPNNLKFPWVIKPAFWASSAYITLCKNKKELIHFYNKITNEITTDIETALHNWKELFYESFISGKEIDIDILIQNWVMRYISISDNKETLWPYFQEIWQSTPSILAIKDQDFVKIKAKEYIKKLNIDNACLHFEAKYKNQELIPIEINLRMWWDEVWYFNHEVYNVDLIEMSVKIACGEDIWYLSNIHPRCKLYWEYILPTKKWTITEIRINSKNLIDLWVTKIQINKKIWDIINIPPDDFSFLWWFIAKINHEDNHEDIIENIYKNITIIY